MEIFEVFELADEVRATEHDWEGGGDQADPGRARRLDIWVLEGQWEEQLEQGLGDVELQRVLRGDQDQSVVEQDRFPAVHDSAHVEHVEEDADGQLVLVGDLVVVGLGHGERLAEELDVVASVEGRARDRSQEGKVGEEVSEGQLPVLRRVLCDHLRLSNTFKQ